MAKELVYDYYDKKTQEEYSIVLDGTNMVDFFGESNPKLIESIDKYMGNDPSEDNEYAYIDEDYSGIENSGYDVENMVEIHKFIDPTTRESLGLVNNMEVFKSKIMIPKGNDVNLYNTIETNDKGTYYLVIKPEDMDQILKGMIETKPKDFSKLDSKKTLKAAAALPVVEELDDLGEIDDEDVISLDELEELDNDDDLDDDFDPYGR